MEKNAAQPRPTIGGRIAALLDAGADDAAIVAAIAMEFPTTKFALDATTAKQNLAWYKNAWRKARGLPPPPRAPRIVLDDTRENAEWLKQSPPASAEKAVALAVTKTTKVERALAKTSKAKTPKAARAKAKAKAGA